MDLLAFCSVHFIISDMICVLYLGCPPGSLRLLRRLTDRQQYLIFTHDKQCKQYHHENKSSYLPWSYQNHGLYFQTYSQLCLYVYLFFSPISILTSQVEKSLTRPEKNPLLKDCGLSGEQWLIWRQPGDEEVDLYYPVFMTVRWYYDNYEMTLDKDAHQSEELLLDFVQQFLNSCYKRILMNRRVSLSGVCLRLRPKIVSIIPAPGVSQTTVR